MKQSDLHNLFLKALELLHNMNFISYFKFSNRKNRPLPTRIGHSKAVLLYIDSTESDELVIFSAREVSKIPQTKASRGTIS